MFRIFLKKKLHSGERETHKPQSRERKSYKRNRRLFDRYNVNQQHLTVLNDQDIFVIRDISAKGFSSDVSPRSYDRFQLGDVYDARIRHNAEMYDMSIRVAWKHEKVVGFELHEPDAKTLFFFRRLIQPSAIAQSLTQVDSKFMSENQNNKTWYHGDNNTDIFIWESADNEDITAWQVISSRNVVQWTEKSGIQTFSLKKVPTESILENLDSLMEQDESLNEDKLRFVIDLLTAANFNEKEFLLEKAVS